MTVLGTVGTDYCNWSPNELGRLDKSYAYLEDLKNLLHDGRIKQTAKPLGARVVTPQGEPKLGELLDRHAEWAAAIARFTDALRAAIRERS